MILRKIKSATSLAQPDGRGAVSAYLVNWSTAVTIQRQQLNVVGKGPYLSMPKASKEQMGREPGATIQREGTLIAWGVGTARTKRHTLWISLALVDI